MPRHYRLVRRFFLRLFVVALVLLFSYQMRYSIEHFVFKNYCAEPIDKTANDARNFGECSIPKINPFNADVMAMMKNYDKPIQCKTIRRATLSGGKLDIFGTDVLSASYQSVHRPKSNDFTWKLSQPVQVPVDGNAVRVNHEFIELTLILANGGNVTEHLFQVLRTPETIAREKIKTELDLNIVIFAMDSTSNGHAQRKLQKSYEYIRDVLQGYVFMGHSAVGDGTTEQLAALLSGKGEREQPEARRGKPGAQVVDGWDWIFKKAKAKGYVTSYTEDSPDVGSFNYRLLGFKDPPADFYPRAFFLSAIDKRDLTSHRHCYGSRRMYSYHFDLVRKFYDQYSDRNKFLFDFTDGAFYALENTDFFADTTHNDFNAAQYIDNDLLNFMKDFKNKGYLENSLLIVMGDHGWRYGKFRQTIQGKLEERLPLFTMIFPEWFKRKYPELDKTLKINTHRLTSWYDVYATLNHILVYPKEPQGLVNGKSLLTEIPAVRSCKDAHIPSHWCPCLQWTPVDQRHDHVHRAVLETVRHINELNSRETLAARHCEKLTLGEVKHSEVETVSNEVLNFYKSGKNEEPVLAYYPGVKDQCNYQVTLTTLPNNGIFEATVGYVGGEFRVKGSVSRIDSYGDQPKCIADSLPHLRKYCQCK